MHRLNHPIRLVLLALAASASFYLGAHWLKAPSATPDAVALLSGSSSAPPTSAAAGAASTVRAERDPTLDAPQRLQHLPVPGGDAFAPLSWLPPPPKPLPPAAPPAPPAVAAPTAPPLPFTFVGLLEQGLGLSQPKAFLARGDALLVVATGDTLETNYSVDSITPQQITLTYLPLKTRQILTLSGATR
jgi:hypothetical protein